jgi:hypothetical protein
MVDSRQNNQWDHTASTLAMLAEINRDRKKRKERYTAREFHPFRAKKKPPIEQVDLKVLKHIFVKQTPPDS